MKQKGYDFHHRLPRSRGGDDSEENLVQVPVVKHQAYHTLFQNHLPEEIARILNETWISKDWELTARRRK